MKRLLAVLMLVVMGVIAGCGGKEKLVLGEPYRIIDEKGSYDLEILGAKESDWGEIYSEPLSENEKVILIEFRIKNVELNSGLSFIGYNFDQIRVCDENGKEAYQYDYHFDKDSFPTVEKGMDKDCTQGFIVGENTRYVEVDIYQNTEYSNKIKLDIK